MDASSAVRVLAGLVKASLSMPTSPKRIPAGDVRWRDKVDWRDPVLGTRAVREYREALGEGALEGQDLKLVVGSHRVPEPRAGGGTAAITKVSVTCSGDNNYLEIPRALCSGGREWRRQGWIVLWKVIQNE